MKWHECGSCTAEFRVVSDTDEPIEFCPYCGYEIVDDVDEDEEEDEF
jgi:DNA-directed RNA polymerase subunit RPC12/RpoP